MDKGKLKIVLPAIALLAIIGIAWAMSGNETIRGSFNVGRHVVAGTSLNYARLPSMYVFAAATTTDAAVNQGGKVIQQELNVEESDLVRINVSAKGGTATSTFGMWVQTSFDGTNYFDYNGFDENMTTSTSALIEGSATTTLAFSKTIFGFDPGTATTTRSWNIKTGGANYLRFHMYGEDIAADPLDNVIAWVEVYPRNEYNR